MCVCRVGWGSSHSTGSLEGVAFLSSGHWRQDCYNFLSLYLVLLRKMFWWKYIVIKIMSNIFNIPWKQFIALILKKNCITILIPINKATFKKFQFRLYFWISTSGAICGWFLHDCFLTKPNLPSLQAATGSVVLNDNLMSFLLIYNYFSF